MAWQPAASCDLIRSSLFASGNRGLLGRPGYKPELGWISPRLVEHLRLSTRLPALEGLDSGLMFWSDESLKNLASGTYLRLLGGTI